MDLLSQNLLQQHFNEHKPLFLIKLFKKRVYNLLKKRKGFSVSHLPNTLDAYWLWKEVYTKLGISNPAYKYWKHTPTLKLNNKYLFIQKDTLPSKHLHVQTLLTDLSGYLPIKYASDQLHVNEHLFISEKMRLHKEFEYKFVEDVKFVNIKKFFKENGIYVGKNALVQLAKLKDLEITSEASFYRLKDDYGLVVYS